MKLKFKLILILNRIKKGIQIILNIILNILLNDILKQLSFQYYKKNYHDEEPNKIVFKDYLNYVNEIIKTSLEYKPFS